MNENKLDNVAFGYVRVSSEEQVEGLSIESQIEKIRDLCERRGYALEIFRDEGRSLGDDDVLRRPAFRRLLAEIAVRQPAAVVTYSLDRWSRSNIVATESFRILGAHNVRFISVTDSGFDLENPAGSLVGTILSWFAKHSSAITARRGTKRKQRRTR